MSVSEQLKGMKLARKSRRLEEIWPDVERILAGGASQAEVLELLNQNGFDLTPGTFKNYVQRLRKRQKQKQKGGASASVKSIAPVTAKNETGPAVTGGVQRPRTFNFDPRGNPDLLK